MLDIIQESIYFQDYYSRRTTLHRREQKNNPEYQLPSIEIDDIINQEELKNFLDDLKCPICINIIEDPKTCINCEANFCAQCIQQWVSHQGEKQCPCCRDQGQERFLYSRERDNRFSVRFHGDNHSQAKYVTCPKIFKKMLSTIQVTCHNKGCNTIIKYDERIGHLKVCMYQLRNCPNDQCEEKVTLLTKTEHIKICEYRKEPCKYCSKQICFKDMVLHEDFCSENKQKCPDCKTEYQIQRITEHEKVCPYKKLLCKICNNQFYRKVFSYHTKAKCYENLFKNSVRDLKKKDRIIERKNNSMEKMESLIQKLKSQLQAESEVDKKQLLEQIEDFYQNKNIEDEQNDEEEQVSEIYPDDFESFEKTLNMIADGNKSVTDSFFFQQTNQKSDRKCYFPRIELNEDIQNISQNYSFDRSIHFRSLCRGADYYGLQQVSQQNMSIQIASQIYSQEILNSIVRNDEEEQKNDTENHQRNQADNFDVSLQELNLMNNVINTNNNDNYYNIFNPKYDDSYFKEIFGNSQDRKDFFNGIEENLLL
ncbi:zinc finger, C3HC4 type (RING finger) protein (macronuclear) [Tetrahymena thermophila SB210]|uniref:Zinc finger, C3HC4 type (RING finger) protein n=1 Tax=Tetrahymena thermophila (strain SB210) TaxID=312017 RepID=Q236K1_TETTS|nr:zinc finger, C3HC4 type (RING finger) protein [Tetrahymena thermophila SB210]EAR92499.2 zinc finger, C3HC4 type (RING finger) protein [Tetrahymena thermophila SB210]|eukprot:XP_001012744.2 zinc finger, C3HC4 type (RING finger) protein [Tetrahymena thermophila SB210]